MGKIHLTRTQNIKNLSKEEFEIYSSRIPKLIEKLTFKTKISSCSDESMENVYKFSGRFNSVGDPFSSIRLLKTILDENNSSLTDNNKYVMCSMLGYFYSAVGDKDNGSYFNTEALKLASENLTAFYLLNLFIQSYNFFDSGSFDLAASTAKRSLDYIYSGIKDKNADLLPIAADILIFKLTKQLIQSNLMIARNLKKGSFKRKDLINISQDYIEKLKRFKGNRLMFFYFCEKASFYSLTGHQGNADQFLDKVHEQLQYKEGFSTEFSYYYYTTTAFYHSCFNNFPESYASAKLAVRASYNYHDVMSEHYVMEAFLDIARKFSETLPEFRKGAGDYELSSDSILRQLIDILEEKDWYTGKQHSSRVASISMKLCQRLLSMYPYLNTQIDQKVLHLAAYMHDIGKLKLPWALLNKIGNLEDYEINFLKKHVTYSRDIMEELNFKDISRIIYQHHENLQSNGYPEKTDDVSISANIISLADSFEAMTNPNRKYKKTKTFIETRDELISLSGKNYYPEITEAFKSLDLSDLE